MHKPIKFLSNVWRDGKQYLIAPLYTLIILLCLLSFCLSQQGCGTTPKALSTEQKLYQTGTNIVGQVDSISKVLPPPFCSACEAGTAIATALLAAWNAWQHGQIKALQNGSGKTSPSTAPVAASPAASPTG
jgi:hypothetical protein